MTSTALVRQTELVGEVLCPVLVGRRAEIQALESALAGALGGHGGCAVITGEAGIGKSRLMRELARLAADQHVPMVMGRAVPASASAPYRPVTEALLQLLHSRRLPDDHSLSPWLPHLGALLPQAAAGDPAARLSGGVDSQVVRGEAVLHLLRFLEPAGLVVAIEDLHWAAAEVSLAGDDLDGARRTAEQVLAMEGAGPDVRCHAQEIVGRSRRLHDLPAAAAAFRAALAIAEEAGLPAWRLRALHELGTVDMFERVDVARLLEARRLGQQMGALSTVAVLDLQLSAAFTGRWDLERCDAHARSAVEAAVRLGLDQVAAKALAMMAGSANLRADAEATEQLAALALAADPADPADPALAGFCRASVGMALFMCGDTTAALRPLAEGAGALSRLPNAEPISIRALWPLIQAARGDRRAAATLEEVRRLGVDAFRLNSGLTAYAQAVLEGRSDRPGRADAIVAGHATAFASGPGKVRELG